MGKEDCGNSEVVVRDAVNTKLSCGHNLNISDDTDALKGIGQLITRTSVVHAPI